MIYGLIQDNSILFATTDVIDTYVYRMLRRMRDYGMASTVFVTVLGTGLSLLFTALLAYPLSTGKLKYAGKLNFSVYFTMLFSGGLIPSYMLISRYLNMKDNIWVLIIPLLINPWNMFLLRISFCHVQCQLWQQLACFMLCHIGTTGFRRCFTLIVTTFNHCKL